MWWGYQRLEVGYWGLEGALIDRVARSELSCSDGARFAGDDVDVSFCVVLPEAHEGVAVWVDEVCVFVDCDCS